MLISHINKSLFIFILLSGGINVALLSQEPAHTIWGQKELSGIDIYDIFQDSKGVYWLTTNSGVFKFAGRTFKSIPTIESKSDS